MLHVVQRVSYQKHCFASEVFFYGFIEQKSTHVSVHCTQDVVQYHNVCIAVDGSCESYPCLLASRNSGSFLSDHGFVSLCKNTQIVIEARVLQNLVILGFDVGLPKQDVVFDSVVQDPRSLAAVSDGPIYSDFRAGFAFHLPKQTVCQGRLATRIRADHCYELSLHYLQVNLFQHKSWFLLLLCFYWLLLLFPKKIPIFYLDHIVRGAIKIREILQIHFLSVEKILYFYKTQLDLGVFTNTF